MRRLQRFNDQIIQYGILPFTGAEVNIPLTVTEEDTDPCNAMINHIAALHNRVFYRWRKHARQYSLNTGANLISQKVELKDPLLGRAYVDPQTQPECTSPAASPMATVSWVNRVKKIFYEASYDFIIGVVRPQITLKAQKTVHSLKETHSNNNQLLQTTEQLQNVRRRLGMLTQGNSRTAGSKVIARLKRLEKKLLRKETVLRANQDHVSPPEESSLEALQELMSPSAIALQWGLKPFNVAYSTDEHGPTGEHFSLSLMHLKNGHSPLTYATAKFNRAQMARDNLFIKATWQMLFCKLLEDYLPYDSMLAYDGIRSFDAFHGNPTKDNVGLKHYIRYNSHDKVGETCRLEIRSFNAAASNIALTTLAVMAVTYAAIKTIRDDPELREKYLAQCQDIAEVDRDKILSLMAERLQPNNHVPYNLQGAVARFQSSLVLRMMREYIADNVTHPEEQKALIAEIDQFEQAVLARPDFITQGKAAGMAR